jgi:hypothetical protein
VNWKFGMVEINAQDSVHKLKEIFGFPSGRYIYRLYDARYTIAVLAKRKCRGQPCPSAKEDGTNNYGFSQQEQ